MDLPRLDIDEIDNRLIDLLVLDGRMTNRALGREVGLTDSSVATRIRRLIEGRAIDVQPQFDWVAAGYHRQTVVYLRVAGVAPGKVAQQIMKLDGVLSLELTQGSADLVVMLLAPDDSQMHDLVTRVANLPGVVDLFTNVVVDVVAYTRSMAYLPSTPIPLESLPGPPFELDDLDRALIECLRRDGRQSASEISRQTGYSDSTILARRRRMEDAGFMRVRAVLDPYNSGRYGIGAHIGLHVSGPLDPVIKRLISHPAIPFCMTSMGSHNIVGSVAAADIQELSTLLTTTLWEIEGVQRVEAWPALRVEVHRSELVRFT